MVYIKGLKFRGFKSFRKAEATFPKGYVCLAGPNGSGKSNVTDAIRFALGEGSLKSLRAKRVSELINTSSKYAEVTLYIDGETQYEIKRAINAEGKTSYKINGKRSKRMHVLEELRRWGLEAGTHNIIAQGQVQKIVEMSGKERRAIIDSVAGISEFDEKKDEAIGELGKVQQRITEANIVLGERQNILQDLEKEKNDALSYISAQENFKRAKASIANMEYVKLNSSFTDVVQKHTAVKEQIGSLEGQSFALSTQSSEVSKVRDSVVGKLGSSASREAALAEIESIKVAISSDSATLLAQKKEASRLEEELRTISSQIDSSKKHHKGISQESKSLSEKLSAINSKLSSQDKKTASGNVEQEELSSQLESVSSGIVSLKEQKAAIEATMKNTSRILEMKLQELERITSAVGKTQQDKLTGEESTLKKEALSLQSRLDSLFENEKELNRQIPELDRRLVSAKEKAATLRASVSPAAISMAVRFVEELKANGAKGIYGQVSSLISCDPKHSLAVEAAAGARLAYVVVDNMDTAAKAIEKLKESKSGRCTFIPLDKIISTPSQKLGREQGCLGLLIDFVDFDAAFQPAMNYVFSDTLVFDNVASAKKAGVGRHRMVTLEGELIEKSGTIAGGSVKGSLLSKSSLDKIEAEAEGIKREKDALYARLYSIREEMNSVRREKAEAEVKLKGIEIEAATAQEKRNSAKKALEDIEEIKKEIRSIQQEISKLQGTYESNEAQLQESIKKHESIKSRLSLVQEKTKMADSESNKLLQGLFAQRSSLEAQLEAKKAEFERLSSECMQKEGQLTDAKNQLEACHESISELSNSISEKQKLQKEKEHKLSELSASSQKLMAQLAELDSKIAALSQQIGKLKSELDKKNRELMDLEVRRQTTQTRLADLKSEVDQYQGLELIDLPRGELDSLAKDSQSTMESLGTVNLKAPEMYEQKKKDIDEVRARVESLDSEKKAVFSMIDEIEAKKRAIFLSTFSSVNDNFRKLFSFVFKGEGTMLLDQPSSPFEGGLLVKVTDQDSHVKYLDSMSGGEKSLLALIFIFSIQMHKAAPFYILDEADAALDKENSRKLSELIRQLSANTQFIVVTHNDTILSSSDVALGVTRTEDGSKIVGVQLTSVATIARAKKA